MTEDQTLNLNQSACIQSWTDFGMTHYQNICSGKVWDVPWGSADWALVIGVFCFILPIILMFVRMAWDVRS